MMIEMPTPTVPDLTADQIRDSVTKANIGRVSCHNCSMCGYPCGWDISGDTVTFDAGCDCTGRYEVRPSSFDDLADNHNMQSHDIHRLDYRNKFGMK